MSESGTGPSERMGKENETKATGREDRNEVSPPPPAPLRWGLIFRSILPSFGGNPRPYRNVTLEALLAFGDQSRSWFL